MRNPSMERRHFEIIAETIKNFSLDRVDNIRLARHFAVALAHTNPQFDSERFIDAATFDEVSNIV